MSEKSIPNAVSRDGQGSRSTSEMFFFFKTVSILNASDTYSKKMREQVAETLNTVHKHRNSKFFITEVRAECGAKIRFCLPSKCCANCPDKF